MNRKKRILARDEIHVVESFDDDGPDSIPGGFAAQTALLRARAALAFLTETGLDPDTCSRAEAVAAIGDDLLSPLAFIYRQFALCNALAKETDPDRRLRIAFSLGELQAHIGARALTPDVAHGRRMKPGSNLGGFNAARQAATARRRAIVAKLAGRTNRTGGARVQWLRDELAARGIEARPRTIREDLKKLGITG